MAVVAHEEAHCAGRDNFLVAIAKSIALTLFYLPGPRMALREMCSSFEKAADRKAAETTGEPLVVAGALARLAKASPGVGVVATVSPSAGIAVGARGNGELVSRIEELVNHASPVRHRWRRLSLFVAGSALAFFIFASSAFAVVGTDQRDAFICFTQHQENAATGDVCTFDHDAPPVAPEPLPRRPAALIFPHTSSIAEDDTVYYQTGKMYH
jgi:hypothetical protein